MEGTCRRPQKVINLWLWVRKPLEALEVGKWGSVIGALRQQDLSQVPGWVHTLRGQFVCVVSLPCPTHCPQLYRPWSVFQLPVMDKLWAPPAAALAWTMPPGRGSGGDQAPLFIFLLQRVTFLCWLLHNFFRVLHDRLSHWDPLPISSVCVCVCVYVCVCVLVAQLCLTLCDPVDYSPPGSSVQEISQARVLEWVAMPSSRGSSWSRDPTHIFYVP